MYTSNQDPLPIQPKHPGAPITAHVPMLDALDADLPRMTISTTNVGNKLRHILPRGLPGIPDVKLDLELHIVGDSCLYQDNQKGLAGPGRSFAEVMERRAKEFAAGEKGISFVGGTQFNPDRETARAFTHFLVRLSDELQKRDIGISNGGGKGPAMHRTSEIYREVLETRNPTSKGKICQVLCEIEPPNGFGDEGYVVRPQRDINSRFQMVKALGPWAVLATPGRIGTMSEIYTTIMDNARRRITVGEDADITPVVLLGFGPDSKNEWWDWVDESFDQMKATMGAVKEKYSINDTIYYVDFQDTERAVQSVIALIEGQGELPPRKLR